MQRFVKALSALILATSVLFIVGCDGPKNNKNGEAEKANPEVIQEVDNGTSVHGHEFVDLGLPSGTLWATCNVGATAPEDHGVKIAWGEIAPKDAYEWYNYKYCRGEYNTFIKYCLDAGSGYNGFVDSITELLSEDDAATANWGSGWCMPTIDQWRELRDNTTMTWVKSQDSNQGVLFTAANGNSLFLPATNSIDDEFPGPSVEGAYWSKTLNDSGAGHPWVFVFNCSTEYNVFYDVDRCVGFSVRPVRSAPNK